MTGVKNNSWETCEIALQYIVQLGRESRARNMKCFWSHCALALLEHAHERIWWLLSWVGSLEKNITKVGLTFLKLVIQEFLVRKLNYKWRKSKEIIN